MQNDSPTGQTHRIRLVLFDIDGTLMSTGGAGTRAMNIAFRDLFGIESGFEGIPMAGRTDQEIIAEGFRKHGISSGNGLVPRYIASYLAHLEREMLTSDNRRLHPGVFDILERLHCDDRVVVGVLTGNLEDGARIKLDTMGIGGFFTIGAYGSDDPDRGRLLHIAMRRYREKTGMEIKPAEAMVVGDTPKDIACSKPHGAVAVAVATGPYTIEALGEHEPDHLFKDLSDISSFLRLVTY